LELALQFKNTTGIATTGSETVNIRVFNLKGMKIFESTCDANNAIELESFLNKQQKGMYFMETTKNLKTQRAKILITN